MPEKILSHYRALLGPLDPVLLLWAAFLLTLGFLSGPPVLRRRVRLLTAYPLWLLDKIERMMKRERGFAALFGLILSLNSASLLTNLLSGLTVILPYLFAWLLGLNLSVILARLTGGRVFAPILLNPVAWLELPAACLSLAAGMRIGSTVSAGWDTGEVTASLLWGGNLYLSVIFPLLFLAALLESLLITLAAGRAEVGGEESVAADPHDSTGPPPDL